MNPSRSPNAQQVEDLQEESLTTLEQFKALENIIASVDIKLYEADNLQELYIIKLKHDICMLETNENTFLGVNKPCAYQIKN